MLETTSTLTAPRCVIVTGPQDTLARRWLEECVRRLARWQPAAHCGVLLAEGILLHNQRVCADTPGVVVHRCFLPCTCCQDAAALPTAVREIVEGRELKWLFLQVPILAAAGLVAEFDRVVRWPREFVINLTPAWEQARRRGTLSPFQMLLIEAASLTFANEREASAAIARAAL